MCDETIKVSRVEPYSDEVDERSGIEVGYGGMGGGWYIIVSERVECVSVDGYIEVR